MERKLKRFNILLDDESLLYFPGSFLTGKVLLELETNTPATGLYFHIIGEGVVRFSDKGGQRTLASDRENYIDFRMRLLGDGDDDDEAAAAAADGTDVEDARATTGRKSAAGGAELEDDEERDSCLSSEELETASELAPAGAGGRRKMLVLSPGVHTFPFKLGLPANLPSTFLGLHGWVQYFCRAILREPSGLIHKNQQVFVIINPIDLNQEPASLQQPFYCEAEEKVRASGAASCVRGHSAGLIACRVRLDRGAFVPGECIQVSASVENSSRVSIKQTRAILTETVEYRAQDRIIQTETRELAAIERGKIGAHSTEVWKKEALQIPALPPTNLRGCQLIKITYDVFFQLITKHNSKRPIELQLPIVMATYPVRNKDGTLKRRKNAAYPHNLPIMRPWLEPPTTASGRHHH